MVQQIMSALGAIFGQCRARRGGFFVTTSTGIGFGCKCTFFVVPCYSFFQQFVLCQSMALVQSIKPTAFAFRITVVGFFFTSWFV